MKNFKYIIFSFMIGLLFMLKMPLAGAVAYGGSASDACYGTGYNYGLSGTSGALNYDKNGMLNVVYSGKMSSMEVFISQDSEGTNFLADNIYKITIKAPTYDLTSNWNSATYTIQGYYPVGNANQCSYSANAINYTFKSVKLLGASGGQYNTVEITFLATATRDNIRLVVKNSNPLTGVSNFKITEIKATWVSGNKDDIIGDNATDKIINNQDKNTNKLLQKMIETDKLLASMKSSTDKSNQTQEDIKNALTDESLPEMGGLENAVGWLPPGPVDSILNLPLSLLNNLSTNLGKTCKPISLTLPYLSKNNKFELPCIKTLYVKMGIDDYLEVIGTIASAFILYYYFLNLYKWVDNKLSLKDDNSNEWGGI